MGHSQQAKAESRERIVAVAARRIREAGLDGFSIADVMTDAGLTHGGFYGHFESRSDLLAAALTAALRESKVAWGEPSKRRTLARVVEAYLSREHRDAPHTGCAVAALGGEVARADPKTRAVMDEHLRQYVEKMGAMLESRQDLAIPIVCAQFGALMMSRLVEDEAFSDRVLDETRAFILSLTGAPTRGEDDET